MASLGPKPHPWLVPLYRRVAVMLVCVGWLVFELYQADPFWTMMAVLATGWAAWDFFLSGNYTGSKPGASP